MKETLYLISGKFSFADVNIDVIGCRKQCPMATRMQPGVAFVFTGEDRIFLARCRQVIILTEPIRAADKIQDLGRVIPR